MKHIVKPDFEEVGIAELSNTTTYGNRKSSIGSEERSYYETALNSFIMGADKVWVEYTEPLLKESDILQAKILEFRYNLEGDNPLNNLLLQLYDKYFEIITKKL